MDLELHDTGQSVLVGIVTFVVVFVSFVGIAPVGGPTVGTILWTAITSSVVVGVLVGSYRSESDRPRAAVAIGVVGVLLVLAPVWFPLLGQGDRAGGETYSGKVAYDEGFSLSFSDPPMSETHVVELERGDRLRIDIDEPNAATWEIRLPDGRTVSRAVGSASAAAVERTDGATYYTANQTGSHRVSIQVRPYEKATYRLSVETS